ncbi:coenzyme F420-0:L-glutamate ligase/coenzyme F420-1:gamma-L-glutamate ligase [Microterricola gilva]|uniref:Coenzyme F420-0:L-glutamate ligase/coenzyme F420-1:gamma-L-glutamate ligase n=1 Tax=Microterricola gilva TaxID=393267 RepID=A0A4Q8AIU7_9MICO|nr:coenzyme F420-0:L-glutamate ligase [Microterricola gilva]RZU63773.1 coenzyme F420-0:L-glutamate ligase/coenzyme F420-1:gamma-L-glutamate ligase [Microterricola gilva]
MTLNRFMARLTTWTLPGMPEVRPGDDLVAMIADAARAAAEPGDPELGLLDGDILVVTSKIVSKAEGRIVAAADREDAITAETVRVVATREHPGGVTRIVENRLGIVAAAAGVDASNTEDGTVLLLPLDPDASARELAAGLRALTGARVGVILSDTLGRPWREGQTDAAIGAAGVHVFDDLRGSTDAAGKPLQVTMPCVADELAAATDLVKGKASGCPVAVVRGLDRLVGELDLPGAASIVRPSERDMFRLGSEEARAEGVAEGYEAGLVEGRGLGYSDGYADGFAEADAEDA